VSSPHRSADPGLVVANTGTSMLTLAGSRSVPADAPFIVESTGFGPFWGPAGRSREIFLTSRRSRPPPCAPSYASSRGPPATVDVVGN